MTWVAGYRWVVLTLALTLSAVVACTSGGGEDQERSRPPITRPLDASDYADRDRICDLLPPKDAAELGYPSPGGESDGEINPSRDKKYVFLACSRYPSEAPFLNYELFANFDILEDSYDTHKDTRDPVTKKPPIEPIMISEQPALVIDSDLKRDETCSITVGLSDNQGFRISGSQNYRPRADGSLEGDRRACDNVIAVVKAIIANLEGDR